MYALIKHLHIITVILSGTLFFVRGLWRLTDSPRLQQRWVKVVPHLIDTVLLLSAIGLAVLIRQYPFVHGWLTAKVLALVIYIGLGMVALRFARSKTAQFFAWCAALAVLAYIVSVAMAHHPWPFDNINAMAYSPQGNWL